MAATPAHERLTPSLLDRLTDDAPDQKAEARDVRVLGERELRVRVLRDLHWLLSTGNLDQVVDLSDLPLVGRSVLNFGIPSLTGGKRSGLDSHGMEQRLREAITNFEPRILARTLRIRTVERQERADPNCIGFHIEGELWAEPMPLAFFLKTEIEVETGQVSVIDRPGPGRV